MYFPLGWPKYLSIGQGQKSKLKYVACNQYGMLFAVLTETTISVWHCKPCVEIVCYQRCHSSIAAIGTNELAEWKQDSSILAVTTTGGYLLMYQLDQNVKGDKGLNLYEYHQTRTNQSDSSVSVPALRLTLAASVNCKVSITSLTCVHEDLLVTLKDGTLKLMFWNDPASKQKSLALSDILFSVDMQLAGLQLKTKNIYAVQAVYSALLEGFALVLSDGRAALVAFNKSDFDEEENLDQQDSNDESSSWNPKGIWAPGLNQATCTAINNRYRLIGFGTKRGDCCIYAIDDATRSLVLSHTIALSPTHYPHICDSVGSVMRIRWSPEGCALALSWAGGGLSVWSVFGACLVCTYASDRAYKSDGTPVLQGIYSSMCWSNEGYQLWLVYDSPTSSSSSSSDTTETEQEEEKGAAGEPVQIDSNLPENKLKRRLRFRKKSPSAENNRAISERGQLLQLHFVKSALTVNPCMSNHLHVILHGTEKIYLSSGERQLKTSVLTTKERVKKVVTPNNSDGDIYLRSPKHNKLNSSPRRSSVPLTSSSQMSLPSSAKLSSIDEEEQVGDEPLPVEPHGSAVANKQWTVIPYPVNYLPSNWPIRHVAVDDTCSFLAIAGCFGFAHYTVISRKWKVFGNVMQEKDMIVTGGLTWWEDFIAVACYDFSEERDEVRLYPRLCNLDNAFACRRRMSAQISLVNVFRNLLLLFTYDCRITIFVVARDTKMQRPMATLQMLQDLHLNRFVPHPRLVVSVTITALHMESTTRRSSSSTHSSRPARETEVIIVNVAGRLLLFQRSLEEDDYSSVDGASTPSEASIDEPKQMKFSPPMVLASCVENIWTTGYKNRTKVHLTDALWMGCGSAGVRVWLPLFPPRQNRNSSGEGSNPRVLELQLLTAQRITLTFSLDACYPLAVLFNEAVILGATSETLLYQAFDHNHPGIRSSENRQNALSYSTIERTCEIYLHQILRQLLRRNLGYHALQVAITCQNLSCFSHVLELMLHEVLEEEATASEPIPDALLPTVLKFLQEFPEYLQTVVHCARKTEIALWEYLFDFVGSPRDLFEECFKTNQLKTAASYLIILQNLEQLSVARQDATKLFDQALQNHMWELANDIARFLRAIGDGDVIAPPRHPTLLNTNIYPAVTPAPLHSTPTDQDTKFKFSGKDGKRKISRQYSMASSYFDVALAPPTGGNQVTEMQALLPFTARKLKSSRSCPTSPPVVVTFSGYKASGSKNQGSSSPSADYPPAHPVSRRHSSRSYTESFHPNKTAVTSSTNMPTSPPSVTTSLSNSFVPRYSVRQYHQDDPVHRPLQHSLSHPVGGAGNSRFKRLSSLDKVATPQSKEHAASECAEHYFIDVILARQARKMLANKQLHMLGTFAAYVDFQLVPWLKKERSRAARVDDPLECFKALHVDFDWPYPTLLPSKSNRTNTSLGHGASHSQSFNDLQTLQRNMPSMHRTARPTMPLGTKSLMDLKSPKRSTLGDNSSSASFATDDEPGSGVLTVLTARELGSTPSATTAASEMSEVLSETSYNCDDSSLNATIEDIHGYFASSMEIDDRRGPLRSEMKLQYLLELFLEARCLEWSLLISIILKDPSHMARLLRSCEEEDLVPLDTLQRTRDCLQRIDQWAVTECSGYKVVLIGCRTQVLALHDVINAREVAHAEKEALKANQQQRTGSTNFTSNATATPTAPDRSKLSKANSGPTILSKTKVALKKQLFTSDTSASRPGVATKCLLNGHARLSSSSDTDEPRLHRQGSLEARRRPRKLRTRHNSVPCSPDSVSAENETLHVRSPSSPAKFALVNNPSMENFSPDVAGAPNSDEAEPQAPTPQGSRSASSDSDEITSESTDEDSSGCAIS